MSAHRSSLSHLATRVLLGAAPLIAAGCWGRNIEYEGGVVEDTAPVEQVECGDESTYGTGFRIEGVAVDFATNTTWDAVAQPMCITAIDPTPAITGGEPTVLASSTLCDDGSFVVSGITEAPAIGAFLVIDDCPGSSTDASMISATGISPDLLQGLGDGGALTGQTALVVSPTLRDTWTADADYGGDLGVDGFLAGYLQDAQGVGVAGATIFAGASLYSAVYGDSDASDGTFTTGGTLNAATDATAFFIIPKAPVGLYEVSDGGTHEWPKKTYGSLPGYAVFVNFKATN